MKKESFQAMLQYNLLSHQIELTGFIRQKKKQTQFTLCQNLAHKIR